MVIVVLIILILLVFLIFILLVPLFILHLLYLIFHSSIPFRHIINLVYLLLSVIDNIIVYFI